MSSTHICNNKRQLMVLIFKQQALSLPRNQATPWVEVPRRQFSDVNQQSAVNQGPSRSFLCFRQWRSNPCWSPARPSQSDTISISYHILSVNENVLTLWMIPQNLQTCFHSAAVKESLCCHAGDNCTSTDRLVAHLQSLNKQWATLW